MQLQSSRVLREYILKNFLRCRKAGSIRKQARESRQAGKQAGRILVFLLFFLSLLQRIFRISELLCARKSKFKGRKKKKKCRPSLPFPSDSAFGFSSNPFCPTSHLLHTYTPCLLAVGGETRSILSKQIRMSLEAPDETTPLSQLFSLAGKVCLVTGGNR